MNMKVRYGLLILGVLLIAAGGSGCLLDPDVENVLDQPFAAFTISTQRVRAHWESLIVDGSPSRSTLANTSIVEYRWDFGDDTDVIIADYPVTDHKYQSGAEEYRISLVVVDSNGTLSDPVYVDISVNGSPNVIIVKTIHDIPPVGEIIYVVGANGIEPMTNSRGIVPVPDDSYDYILLTSFGSTDDLGIKSYHWMWGDHDLGNRDYLWIKAPKYRDDIYRIVLWICDTEGLCGYDMIWI